MIDLRILELAAEKANKEMLAVGESYNDQDILNNMDEYIDIVDKLIVTLQDNATDMNKWKSSVKRISDKCIEYLIDLKDGLNETIKEYEEQESNDK